ncbi:TetR/AcrR family transcriptional regulator [Calothrix sp. PCC 6303]|uniref:TetR/AcrR family transcriptional regulator n=1 Tax=Calothrix sp. PCC 6303 TaxID=1170562 RepID=UPI0002A05675|nr:TetR/AcrR family transcriptional regulator [Calothrix sp. PCC 6303]AFZ02802.1 transcriptional regulator, TetR family [Calothrix sp. PCC 6303]
MPKIVDHKQYRKELLAKSFNIFAERGYGAVTMRHLSQGLGVSTGTLYHYFPSKRALFEQLVEEETTRDILIVSAEFKEIEGIENKLNFVGRYLTENQDYQVKWMYIMVDFFQTQDAEEVRQNDFWERLLQRFVLLVYDLLGVEDLILANFVISFIDGIIIEKILANEMVDFNEQCQLLGKMLSLYVNNLKK